MFNQYEGLGAAMQASNTECKVQRLEKEIQELKTALAHQQSLINAIIEGREANLQTSTLI